MTKRIHILSSIFLLTLFLTHLSSTTLFSHNHVVNGVKLVHSHPYSNSQHSHSESQLLTIALLSSFNGLEPLDEIANFEAPLHYVCNEVKSYNQPYLLKFETGSITLRAPPVC